MAFDLGWAHAPDSLQGAAGTPAAGGGVLYVFAEGELDVPAIEIGTEEMDDQDYIGIVECHVHIRTDQPQRIHVTWKLESPNLVKSDFYQWFTCSPDGSVAYDNNGGMKAILDNNPSFMSEADKNPRRYLAGGVRLSDGADIVNEHTLAYSTMLATELAQTMTPDTGRVRRPGWEREFALGWGLAPDQILGVNGAQRGSDVVYSDASPVNAAAGYPITKCEIWLSPAQEWAASITYMLTAPERDVDVTHWYTIDGNGGFTRNGESVSADGSAPADPAKAAQACSELWPTSDSLAGDIRIFTT